MIKPIFSSGRWRGVWTSLSSAATLLCLCGLLAWGHWSHWKLPFLEHGGAHAGAPIKAFESGEADGLFFCRFRTEDSVQKLNFQWEAARLQPLEQYVTANGVVDYDRTRVAQLSARVPGSVWRVERVVGEAVRKGEVLAILDAAEVGRIKSEVLKASVQVDLKTYLLRRLDPSVVPARSIEEAQAALRDARIRRFNAQQELLNLGLPLRAHVTQELNDEELIRRVKFLGLPNSLVATLDPETTTANLLPVFAPFDAEIIESEIVPGEPVSTSSPMFVLADVSRMWILLDVRQEDGDLLHGVSHPRVLFKGDGASNTGVEGRITWISTSADARTRTIRARATVDNGDRRLRANTFGTGRILVRSVPSALTVPPAAVQSDGEHFLVFVRRDPRTFEVRRVVLGARLPAAVEIRTGIRSGEEVVTAGSQMLKSEMVRWRSVR